MTIIETGSFGRVPYVRIGRGPETIVVINGGNAFVRRFDPSSAARNARQIARLFPADRSICILGYDSSAAPPCDVTAIAADFAEIIRTHFGTATVAGISFGGLVATRLAAEHPELVPRLILLATAHRFSDEGRRRVRQQISDAARGDFTSMARPFLTLFRRPWLNLLLRFAIWSGRRSLAEKMNAPSFIVCMLASALAASEGAHAHLAQIRATTLLVAGTRDQFFDLVALQETAAAIPAAELVLFANETHMLPLERPRPVARAVETFLRR
ncbi:MAG TPA: alpha/beta hydrolase [Thermoanaerobaculia bacterium]|nr:alpha/beta hydrolase [Thermoanaerobaculia bacterium]